MKQKQVIDIPAPSHDYVGRKPCGCVVAIVADLGDKETGQNVAELIKDGLIIDRLPRQEAAHLLMQECPHKKGIQNESA